MFDTTHRIRTLTALVLLFATSFAASDLLLAQDAAPPVAETPRPEDFDPAVDTSAPAPVDEPAESADQASATPEPTNTTPAPAAQAAGQGAPGSAAQAAPARSGSGGRALDRIELDTTQITGNRELPKVLYIVPWKRSDLGDLVGKPINSLLDEVLTPVDRDVFRRENRYYQALTPDPDAPGSGAASAERARRTRDDGARAAGSVGSALQSRKPAEAPASPPPQEAPPASADER